jgi:uncharacterized protein with FMN-binding domain
MKYCNFFMKLISLVLVLCIVLQYQKAATGRAELVAEHDAKVAEINAYNAEILKTESESPYEDGTYQGTGTGYGGNITVEVTIEDGKFVQIEVLSADDEDPAYYNQAEAVLEKMITKQSTEIDTVSGATYSSEGLIEATTKALEKAVK